MSTDYEEDEYDETTYDDDSTAKWASAVVALLGLWLVAAPLLLWETVGSDFWNDVLVGGAIVVLAAYSYYESSDEDESTGDWASSLNVLLGLWLIVAPFIWAVDGVEFWNDVIVGALVAIVAGYAVLASREERPSVVAERT